MTDHPHRSFSFKRQTSWTHSKPQIRRQTSWAGKGPVVKCLFAQDTEPQSRDIVVVVQEKSYHLHSSLLGKVSPVFPVIQVQNTDANGQVHIEDVTSAGFDAVVDWIYHEKVHIKVGHLQEIYQAAITLQVQDVEDVCQEYIKSTTHSDCQGEILKTCLELNLDELLKHVLQSRPEIILHQGALDSLNLNQLTRILGSDHLNIQDERCVLQAANRWMTHRKCSEEDVLQILKVVRLGLLSKDDLELILEDISQWSTCQALVKEAMVYLEQSHLHPLTSGEFCRPRGIPKCFIFGGLIKCDPDPINRIPFKLRKTSLAFDLDPRISHVEELPSMPDKVVDPVTLSKNNCVFAVGGYVGLRMSNKGEGTPQPVPGNLCLRYQARSNCWEEMAPLTYSRWCHGAAWCGNYIVVIGGVTSGCLTYGIGTVELYDIALNSWSLRSPFPYGIRNLAACDVRGHVFISGGCIDYKGSLSPTDHVYWYDVTEDRWHLAGHMCKVREYHSMAGKDHNVYIIGGKSDVTAEIFDTLTHQSTLIEAVPGQLVHSPIQCDYEEDEGTEEKDTNERRKTVLIPELIKFNIAVTDEELILAGGVQQMNVIMYNTTTKHWTGRRVPINARRYNTSFALLHTPSGGKLPHHTRRMSSCSIS